MLRRLIKHHPEVFFSKVTLHNVVLDVVKWADSLRSSLSKNALIVLEEMCQKLRKSMDTEISELLKILLKKTTETNVFISQQAKKTLEKMLESLSEQKILPFVLFHAQNAKKSLVKADIAYCLGRIFRKAKDSLIRMRDIEKALQILSEYTTDASSEVRDSTKQALEELNLSIPDDSELEILLIRSLKESQYQKIKKQLEKKAIQVKSLPNIKLKVPQFKLRPQFPKLITKKSAMNFSNLSDKMQESD